MRERRPRRRPSITSQIVLVAALVAIVAVLVAGLVSLPLVRGTADAQARATLARLADLVTVAVSLRPDGQPVLAVQVASLLQAEQVEAYVVLSGATPPPGVTEADVAALAAGDSVSTVSSAEGDRVFVEGRPLGHGLGVVLVQDASVAAGPGDEVVRRLALALLAGLTAAVIIGALAARRITRPLQRAAEAANRLSTGERGVVARPEGPEEVAAIAESLNQLSTALAVSEGRQRDFLLSVSHELRTPLTAVRGYAEALADDVVPAEEVPRIGGTLHAEAQRLDRLVSDLLDLARLGAVDFRFAPVEVDLDELGREAAGVWADRCARHGVPFAAELPGRPLLVRTDPMRLRQIVDNLAENALRVTPEGRPIVLALRQEGEQAVVEVRDGGPGLTELDQEEAFEPGVLHERYRGVRQVGTGLGLALVGRLAAGLGGSAEAGTAPEGGARFTVRIPGGLPGRTGAPLPPGQAGDTPGTHAGPRAGSGGVRS